MQKKRAGFHVIYTCWRLKVIPENIGFSFATKLTLEHPLHL
jgi:hypothetical protein